MKKQKLLLVLLIAVFLVFFSYIVASYLGFIGRSEPKDLDLLSKDPEFRSEVAVNYVVEEVASNLFVPWSIVFTSNERVLVSERDGNIRVINNGELLEKPLYVFDDISHANEEGLMGMELSPDYDKNKFFYVCYAFEKNDRLFNRIVKLKDLGTTAEFVSIVLDDLPSAKYHAGCRVKFGPDLKMYVTVGDAGDKDSAQDINSLAGKILRLNEDGTIPKDNPFNNYVYSLGHRNSQGIAWDINGNMYSTEHGPSLFDGPAGGDEVNRIEIGKNYGWPLVSHEKSQVGLVSPLTTYTPAVAPASALIYTGKMFPQFTGDLFFGGLRGEGLFRLSIDANKGVLGAEKVDGISFGRIRGVVESPIGEIWFSTSNRDGRGKEFDNDDKIYKLVKR